METNGYVSGVGAGYRHSWEIDMDEKFLCARGRYNGLCVMFDLASASDIRRKLEAVEMMRDKGVCLEREVQELREIIRTYSDLTIGGNGAQAGGIGDQTGLAPKLQFLDESAPGHKVIYTDGVMRKIRKRKKMGMATPAQISAAENARAYAHTPEADAKRRKSIAARQDGKILGEI